MKTKKIVFLKFLKRNASLLTNIAFFSLVYVTPAFAQVAGDNPAANGLQWLITMALAVGACLATLALMVIGILCKYHVIEWKHLTNFVIGCSFFFGAGVFVDGLIAVLKRI